MAARGNFATNASLAPPSPGHPLTVSPAVTIDRHPTITFEPTGRSLDFPRSPSYTKPHFHHEDGDKATDDSKHVEWTDRAGRETWFSRLFGKKTGHEASIEKAKEYP